MAENTEKVKRPRILGFVLSAGLILQSIFEIALAILLASRFVESNTQDNIFIVYVLQTMVGAALIVNFIMLMFWIWRTVRNTGLLGIRNMTYSPGWSIGWWFIPLANLFAPYMALSEIYRANRDMEGWRKSDHPFAVIVFWLVTLVQVSVAIMIRFIKNPDGNIDPNSLHLVLYSLGAVRVLSLLFIIIRIGGFQKHLANRLPLENIF